MAVPNLVSPASGNYIVPRGYMTMLNITLAEEVYTDVGNIPMLELTPKPTNLDHFRSRDGVRTKDFVAVTQLDATMAWQLDEWQAKNMGNALLGAPNESGTITISMFSQPQIYASFKFFGTNSVGPVWDFIFPYVLVTPQKALSLISPGSGSWGTFDMQGDVLKDPNINNPTYGEFAVATSVSFG